MATTLPMSPSHPITRLRTSSNSGITQRTSRTSLTSSQSPPPLAQPIPTRTTPTLSPRLSASRGARARGSRSSSLGPSGSAGPGASISRSKENVPIEMDESSYPDNASPKILRSGKITLVTAEPKEMGNGGGKAWRDGSVDVEDEVVKTRKSHSVRSSKSPVPSSPSSNYNGLTTLPTISDPDAEDSSVPTTSKPPPPAASTQTATGRPLQRKRRSSSIKRKPSPGVTPTNVVDWEIPRKSLHSSIGFLTLLLYYLDPKDLRPLLMTLSTGLVSVYTIDLARLRFPAFAELWEAYVGFLMREQERKRINGVVWYLMGVITVLAVYPRDVAVISILTLSWSDTTASTIGRLWGKYTPPLPSHVPGIKRLRFAPRKSLAGFLAATFTGMCIGLGFWWAGSEGRWQILDGSWAGLLSTSSVVGVGGAIAEALDLGLDDNLTLPILTGAIVWAFLSATNRLFA